MNKKSKCCMVGNHLCQLLRRRWKFLCLVFAYWNYSLLYYIQKTCSRQCGFLNQGVLPMRNQPMCTTGLGCLPPFSSYHLWCVLIIGILASNFPCPPWCSWSLWCTGTIWRAQCQDFPFLIPIVILHLWNVWCLHLSFLVLWNSHLYSSDPYLLVITPLCLAPIKKNQLIPQCNT